MLTSDALNDSSRIRHGFFTREGGVSKGIYASLNCGPGSNDDPADVAENRARVAKMVGAKPEALATLHQIHSPTVVTVDKPVALDQRPKADAMVTVRAGIALGISTADCAPVLFADRQAGVVGGAHAGWRGALGGVLEATIDAMATLGADRAAIAACVGPTIAKASYEVGPEFPTPFLDQDAANDRFFGPSERAGHFMFDLPGYVTARLTAAGIGAVEDLGRDTRSDEARFFSYRRTTLCGEPDYGRQLSVIMLAD